jgi:membrane protease YdiL (CAAX protease family)
MVVSPDARYPSTAQVASSPARGPVRARAMTALVAYLVLLTAAEVAVTFISPLLVFPLHAGLIGLIALYMVVEWPRDRHSRAESALVLVLVLGPLVRVISLTLPLAQIDEPYRYVAAGVPMLVGGIVAARAIGIRATTIGMRWGHTTWQVGVILAAVPIGFIEFVLLRPAPIGGLPWEAGSLVPALSVGFFTGFPEELIFRGLLQTITRPFLGRWNWIYAAAIFAVLHIGYRSYLDVLFVFGAGLLFGWVFERTRSIIGISISHGLANITLFFVAPSVIDAGALPTIGPQWHVVAAMATVLAVSYTGYRISHAVIHSRRRPGRRGPAR